jgi:hypothetical protein
MASPYHTTPFAPSPDPTARCQRVHRARLAGSFLRIASTATRRALASVSDPDVRAHLQDALARIAEAEVRVGATPPHAGGR